MTDQRKLRQNVGLENMNMMSNYDVTKNSHQTQMTPSVPDLPIGYIGLNLGPQDPRGSPKNCGTH